MSVCKRIFWELQGDTGSTKNTNYTESEKIYELHMNYTESEKIYELQESVLKFQPPNGAVGEVNKITSPNSPCDQTLDCSNPGITLTTLRIKIVKT